MMISRLLALAALAAFAATSKSPKAVRWDRTSLSGQLASMDDQSAGLQSQNGELQDQMAKSAAQLAGDAQAATAGDAEAKSRLDAEKAALARQQAAIQNNQTLMAQTQNAKQDLLDATGGSEAKYRALLGGASVGGVYAQHAALDASAQTINNGGGPCGDYPPAWCAAPPNSAIRIGGSGFLNRQCVAYAAYERWKHGQPFATGDAGDWPGRSLTPTVGSVAIWNRGTASSWGHVAYVTAVRADGITISEFNWHPFLYSSRDIKLNGRGWPSRFWN